MPVSDVAWRNHPGMEEDSATRTASAPQKTPTPSGQGSATTSSCTLNISSPGFPGRHSAQNICTARCILCRKRCLLHLTVDTTFKKREGNGSPHVAPRGVNGPALDRGCSPRKYRTSFSSPMLKLPATRGKSL